MTVEIGGHESIPAGGSGAAPRLHEQAHRILASEIAQGLILPGSRLMESHVAARFGISRAPARQALAALEAEGLAERSGGRGYTVCKPPRGFSPSADADPDDRIDGHLAASASWERIYKEIETAIVSRTPFATWRVVESELAKAYGVSRTVARDVVARLNQRGIVRKDARSRWIAPGLTPEHVGELYEMRWVLEPAALVNASSRMPIETVRKTKANVVAALAVAETLDGAALDALEAELHVDLLGYCGNRTMMEGLAHYQSLLIAHSYLYDWAPQLYPVEPFLPEHLAVLERLEAGAVDEAAAALEAHLRASLDRAVHRIEVFARALTPTPLPYLVPEPAPGGA